MRTIFIVVLLSIISVGYSQAPTLEPGVYKSNVKGQKIMLKVLEDNKYEMTFLYGKYSIENDTINFRNLSPNESNFKIKTNTEAPFSSTLKIKFVAEYAMYMGKNIYIGTQKDENAVIEYKSLLDCLKKKSNLNHNNQKEFKIDVEKTKYLYFVEANPKQNPIVSKFQIDPNANEIEVEFNTMSLSGFELKGTIDPTTKKLSIMEGKKNKVVFTFEKDDKTEVKSDEVSPVEVVLDKDWIKNNGFVQEKDDSAYFGRKESAQYSFNHTVLKSYQEALKSIEKTPTKFLVVAVDNSKEGSVKFNQFIKTSEEHIGIYMRRRYDARKDHFNFYLATEKDKSLLDNFKIKDKTALLFFNPSGELVYHTKGTLQDNEDIFEEFSSIYYELERASAKLKLDKLISNKKTTLPDIKNGLLAIVKTKKEPNSESYADTTAVTIENDYDVETIDTTATVSDEEDNDMEGNYFRVSDRENLYTFKTAKEIIAEKWKLIVDSYTKNNSYDQDFVTICKNELNDSGFTFKLYKEKKSITDIDFKILDYLYKNYAEIVQNENKPVSQAVEDVENVMFDNPIIDRDITASLSLFFQKRCQALNYDYATHTKLMQYYKTFLKLSGYQLNNFEEYLQKIKEKNLTNNTVYYTEYETFFQSVMAKNPSLIETLDEMYMAQKENYADWEDFKGDFSRLANNVAWNVVETKNNDAATIQKAINWSETSLKVDKKNYYFLDTLGQLYYKNHERDKAILTEQMAIDNIEITNKEKIQEYTEVLEKMKNGTY